MESQPQNPEFRNNPENFHPCISPMLFRLVVCADALCPVNIFFCHIGIFSPRSSCAEPAKTSSESQTSNPSLFMHLNQMDETISNLGKLGDFFLFLFFKI